MTQPRPPLARTIPIAAGGCVHVGEDGALVVVGIGGGKSARVEPSVDEAVEIVEAMVARRNARRAEAIRVAARGRR